MRQPYGNATGRMVGRPNLPELRKRMMWRPSLDLNQDVKTFPSPG